MHLSTYLSIYMSKISRKHIVHISRMFLAHQWHREPIKFKSFHKIWFVLRAAQKVPVIVTVLLMMTEVMVPSYCCTQLLLHARLLLQTQRHWVTACNTHCREVNIWVPFCITMMTEVFSALTLSLHSSPLKGPVVFFKDLLIFFPFLQFKQYNNALLTCKYSWRRFIFFCFLLISSLTNTNVDSFAPMLLTWS